MAARRATRKPPEPKRHALLVPISHYPTKTGFGELAGVVRDAERLRALLENPKLCGVDSLEVVPPGRATRQRIIEKVEALAKTAGLSDQVILYFGGHAHRALDETHTTWNYWFVPYDGSPGDPTRDGLSAADFAGMLEQFGARELVLILDFCYSGGVVGALSWPGSILERVSDASASRFVLAATLSDEEEGDTAAGSLFVQELCAALEGLHVAPDGEGRISIQQAWCHAAAAVEEHASTGPDRQHSFAAGIGGPIYLTRYTPRRSAPIAGIYPHAEHTRVFDLIRNRIPRSRNILLVGTGLNVAWEREIPKLLLEHARNADVRIDICLANPRNPSVRSRLVEERMWHEDPPLDRRGIERRVRTLLTGNRRLPKKNRMRVRLFEHYPTMATLIFDDDIFVYPYGFHALGTQSPITHIRDDGSDEVRFYRDNARRIFDQGIPAESALTAWKSKKYVDPEWIAAAVYLIPARGTKLYKFGSGILGYDIYRPRRRKAARSAPPTRGRPFAGAAARYGFHVTLADALYFRPETLERVEAEVRVLASEFKPFRLTGIHPASAFHGDPQMFALRCNDVSGSAEALHHELVARVYSLALSSTYRAGTDVKAPPVGPTARQRNFINRFFAPYILGKFDPHFTLCANMPPEEAEHHRVADEIIATMERVLGPKPKFPVHELHLVTRARGEDYWSIRASYPLTG